MSKVLYLQFSYLLMMRFYIIIWFESDIGSYSVLCSDSYIKDIILSKPHSDLILTHKFEPNSEHNRTLNLTTEYGHNLLTIGQLIVLHTYPRLWNMIYCINVYTMKKGHCVEQSSFSKTFANPNYIKASKIISYYEMLFIIITS